MGQSNAMILAVLGAAVLTYCVGLPQIPSYNVHEVNSEVFDEVDNVETTDTGFRYVQSKVVLEAPNPLRTSKDKTILKAGLVKSDSDNQEEDNGETKYVKVQEKIAEDGLSAPDVAGSIAFEVLDEVGDHLGSRGAALKKMEYLLKNARG
ncbi:uncharacterized protein [Palaemon carinicauda]|uniref:uncharacterized protein n=1 Tax=Palaemon carinicauda TaxID=392227 RepID=UPI0035B5EF2D